MYIASIHSTNLLMCIPSILSESQILGGAFSSYALLPHFIENFLPLISEGNYWS